MTNLINPLEIEEMEILDAQDFDEIIRVMGCRAAAFNPEDLEEIKT